MSVMVFVIIAMSLHGFCPYAHAAHFSHTSLQGTAHEAFPGGGGPDNPVEKHSAGDHCDSSCNCPCHAPIAVQPIRAEYAPLVSPLVFIEPFTAFPEVYLPKFIPPQNLC